jgi:hypothetical protein
VTEPVGDRSHIDAAREHWRRGRAAFHTMLMVSGLSPRVRLNTQPAES